MLSEEGAGRNVLLLVDEGQRLDAKMLEVLRVLVNFETNEAKCLQIVLAGQLELKDRLFEAKNRALRSRIFAPTLMSALSPTETVEMIEFRCGLAEIPNPVTREAVDEVYALTAGVPRDIVKILDIAWFMANLSDEHAITAETVRDAEAEARLREEQANAVAQ